MSPIPPSPLRRAGLAVLAALSLTVVLTAGAEAASVSAVDERAGVSIALDGASVTIAGSPTPSARFLAAVQGKRVTLSCYAALPADASPSPPVLGDVVVLSRRTVWPAGAQTLTAALPHDISASADLCRVLVPRGSASGVTVAMAGYTADGRRFITRARRIAASSSYARRKLRSAYRAVKAAAVDGSFPTGRGVVRAIRRSEGGNIRAGTAPTFDGIKRSNVVYVITGASSKRRVVLACTDSYGTVHVLTSTVKGGYSVS